MRKIKGVLICTLIISIVVLGFYLIPMRITEKVPLTSEDISIKVERSRGNTGPAFLVDEDKKKLKKILKEKYPDKDIEPHYIELKGNLPYGVVNDPGMLGGYVVHGVIISPDGGEEKSVIIDVKYTDAKIARVFRDDLPNDQNDMLYTVIALATAINSAVILMVLFLIRHAKIH